MNTTTEPRTMTRLYDGFTTPGIWTIYPDGQTTFGYLMISDDPDNDTRTITTQGSHWMTPRT